MQKTVNYNLKKPEVTDPLRVADFNENADIMDAALAGLNTAVAAGLKIETGSYNGTGVCGSTSPNTLTFSFPPKIVGIVVDGTAQTRSGIIFLSGQSKSSGAGGCSSSGGTFSLHLTWSGNSVSWYTDNTGMAENQLNASGYTYRYFAFG